MKIVVIGGTGLIGSKLVEKLRQAGHEPLPASPDTGVNTLTGEGLDEALAGADVVVDVSNAPAWEDAAVLDFFQTSSRNLARRGEEGGRETPCRPLGCRHRPPPGERLLPREGRPGGGGEGRRRSRTRSCAQRSSSSSSAGSPTRVPRATRFAWRRCSFSPRRPTTTWPRRWPTSRSTPPLNDTVELAGPEPYRLDELAARVLRAKGDPRQVKADAARSLFRRRARRPLAHARRQPAHRSDSLRGLAQPGERIMRPDGTIRGFSDVEVSPAESRSSPSSAT